MLLFENQTTNGNSLVFPASDETHTGGPVWLAITGTFDGATVHLEINQESLGFTRLVGVDQTQNDVNRIALGNGHQFRLELSSAGASTDITASVIT